MAETNFQAKSSIKVAIGSGSANLGVAHAVDDTWNFLQVVDFNMQHASVPVEVSPMKNGILGQLESQGTHRNDTQMYEITLTMRGTPTAVLKSCLALFGDGASEAILSPASETNNNAGNAMINGAANIDAVTLLFENGGSDAAKIDSSIAGCFCTSMTLREDVGSDSGEMMVESTFVSAYRPLESAFGAPNSPLLDTDAPKSIFSISTSTIDGQPLVVNSWEINISRPLARVSYIDTTDFKPFGYAQTGPYEVTGTIVCKRDDSIEDLAAHMLGDSTGIAIALAESSGFTIDIPDAMIDNSQPEVGDYMLQSIPFRAFAASETAKIIGITIA